MYSKFVALLLGLAITLAGCSAHHKAEYTPPAQDITPGATFTVTRDFLIPSGDSSVYFQDTKLYPQGDIQNDDPVCQFVLNAATAAGQVISSRVFAVSNVSYDENGVGPRGKDATVTVIQLQDTSSGETVSLKCMLPLMSHGARPVTRAEIQGALKNYINLKLTP